MHSKLKPSDLLHRSKGVIQHTGVYLGNGLVFHNLPEKGVIISSYAEFADGKEVNVTRVELTESKFLAGRLKEIINNDSRYHLFANNCEHVAHYLITGRKMSPQIQAIVIGLIFGGVACSQLKQENWLQWLAGGAVLGLVYANLTAQYDYSISPIPGN